MIKENCKGQRISRWTHKSSLEPWESGPRLHLCRQPGRGVPESCRVCPSHSPAQSGMVLWGPPGSHLAPVRLDAQESCPWAPWSSGAVRLLVSCVLWAGWPAGEDERAGHSAGPPGSFHDCLYREVGVPSPRSLRHADLLPAAQW